LAKAEAVSAYIKARDALETFFLELDNDPGKNAAIAAFTAAKSKRDNWRERTDFGPGGRVIK
jgi:hypothetical protein